MTPERSQSPATELLSNEANSIAPSSSTASSNTNQIRIKNVSEINSNEAEASPPSPPVKRKLPAWMNTLTQEDCGSLNKKLKLFPNGNSQAISTSDPEASTSGEVNNDAIQSAPANEADGSAFVEENVAVTAAAENGEAQMNAAVGNANSSPVDDSDTNEASANQPDTDSTAASSSNFASSSLPLTTVKTEPADDIGAVGYITPTSPRNIKPAAVVKKEEATSSTTRESCKYGIHCYRENPIHRYEEAHPGDNDYRRPDYPAPPDGTPPCLYGDLCYRRNPSHFRQFSHPPLS